MSPDGVARLERRGTLLFEDGTGWVPRAHEALFEKEKSMKKDVLRKLQLSKETLRALETTALADALGGATTDVTGACSRPLGCNSHNTCTSQFC